MKLSTRIEAVLGAHQTLVLATAGADGRPEAASIFFTAEQTGEALLLVGALLSRSSKLTALRENARVGVFIGPQTPTRWLQAECRAAIVEDDAERERRLQQLVTAVPAAAMFVERVPVTAVVFRVGRIKLTDLTGGQPPIEVVELEREAGG